MGKGGFQSSALALVHLMVQHLAAGQQGSFFKMLPGLAHRAVVHDHDVAKAPVHQLPDHGVKLVVRVQGGQNDRQLLQALLVIQ